MRQGDLDALCGVYAVINAVRRAIGTRAPLDEGELKLLFSKLMRAANKEIGALRATTYGMDAAPLWKLTGAARTHIAKRHGLELTAERPFHGQKRVPSNDVLLWLDQALPQTNSAVLVGLEGEFDHWTVAHRFTTAYLAFFDSAGFSRVRIERCRRESIIDGASIIWLRLA
ncbi:hypothetical protein GGR25_001064 [Kaistia hirudinis]|uniref:Uncharacterized protein n=1 Tax=Kaistia hirudinis TaxID=1293440 RepID=A0A840ANC2_9HYPH|nr:hypothetical protein [Kaistia hirudinis]MBB3930025.1 hypothetical protein [Kaistia hirudinis]